MTHDQEEALSISDQVCVMHDGVVQQVGSPWIIYNRPANRFVATFVGSNNFIPVTVDEAGQPHVLGQSLSVPASIGNQAAKGLIASIRPEKIVVNKIFPEPGVRVGGVVRQAMFTGRELQLTVEVSGYGLLDALTEPSAVMIACLLYTSRCV